MALSPQRAILGLSILLVPLAWAPAAAAVDYPEARHLLSRTGFGATPVEIERLGALNYDTAVRRLLDGTRTEPLTPAPAWVDTPPPDPMRIRAMSETERKAFQRARREEAVDLKAWWYAEMIRTDSPLTERMTLFWHNHFTSSIQKVKSPTLLYRQNLLLRRHALGDFRTLLRAVARDPAMVLYLDNQTNRKGQPNENFARELLELFTLGEGRYREQDIKEAARAFTGWQVDRRSGAFRFAQALHDDGTKTFLGKSGRFHGDDILDILLEQPRVAVHVTEKLWREFVSDTPDAREVQRLAAIFRANRYELRPLMQALLATPQFRAAAGYGGQTKSPTELMVGTVRLFGISVPDTRSFALYGRRLGQDLFDPPNVKGWPGGSAWITSDTLLARAQFLQRVLRGREMKTAPTAPGLMRAAFQRTRGADLRMNYNAYARLSPAQVAATLLPVAPVNPIQDRADIQRLIGELVLDPAYQLK